ncbi:MAG: hypothetical protein IPK20_12180 [Betaproteobacteria bacterium]|nr:hypothetical protein [Betaproteobacteria bacterium]
MAGFHACSPSKTYGDFSVNSMVSGHGDMAPRSIVPLDLACAMASRSSNTDSGVTLLCRSAAITNGRPAAEAHCSNLVTGCWASLVTINTP